MKLYYITSKNSPEDIIYWEADIRRKGKSPISCLAFFYEKEWAEDYLEILNKGKESGIGYEIKSVKIC